MSDTTKIKKPNMIHIGIGILTVLLVVFIVILMQLVSNIQGTARVVNYAGLIRGETQRIIKLENSGQREDELIKEVQSFIEGLRHGNDQLKLVRLKDDDFQDKMKELDEYFISLHKEIYRVRTVGYEHTDIISKSERFFKICDEATGALDVSIQNQIAQLLVKLVEEKNIGCLFIGHDLALVRSVSQRIAVMYLGRIVELLESETLGEKAMHPYTKMLLGSIFDVYCDQNEEIAAPKGEPPSPLKIRKGCAFAERCSWCSEKCKENVPPLQEVEPGHKVACFQFTE